MFLALDRFAASPRPALIDAAGSLSYAELTDGIHGGARALGERLRGQLLFLFAANTTAAALTYLAAREAGAAVALFPARLAPERVGALLDLYRPHLVAGSRPEAGYAEAHVIPGGLALWRRVGSDTPALHPELAVLLSTSGSTGSPKLVRLSAPALTANAAAIAAVLRIGAEARAALNLPISYSYGLSVLHSHLFAGASAWLTEEGITSPGFWRAAAEHRITSMPGVPYVYETLHRLGFERLAPPSLTCLTQAGGRLADPLVLHFHEVMHRRNGRFYVMYGQTEASPRMATLDDARLPEKLGSVGSALPGGRFDIDARAGGEIVYSGANVMLGYAERAQDLARGDELGGVLRTGDLGCLDGDGFLYVTGRLKRIAKINGLRINLDEVEALAGRECPSAVIEEANRLVVFCEIAEAEAAALRRRLCGVLELPAFSLQLRPVAKLPTTENGKIDRRALGVRA